MSRAPVAVHARDARRKAGQTPSRAAIGSPVPMPGHLGTGEQLPADVRSYFEPRFGADLSDVRLHRDAAGESAAEAAGAHAFTIGRHIAFNAGRFAPATTSGRRLLGHELAHVVQQSRGGAAPGEHAGSEVESDARQAGHAAAAGAAIIPVRGASSVGIARDANGDERTKNNADLANRFYTSFLSSPLVPDTAKKAVEGTNDWLKQEATKYRITDVQRQQVVAMVVEAVGQKAVADAQALVEPSAAPRPAPAPQPAAALPQIILPVGHAVGQSPPKTATSPSQGQSGGGAAQSGLPAIDFDALQSPVSDPNEIVWTGNPATQPRWTRGMKLWTGPNGDTNLYTPDAGLSVWNREGKQQGLPPPGAEKIDRAVRAASYLDQTGGRRFVLGRGWLDERGWRAYLEERKTILRAEAERKIDNLQSGTEAWDKTQRGWAYFASVPSHTLGGRSLGDPARIVASARQDVEIALHEIDKAQTPDELAEAEGHVKFSQNHGDREFYSYKEDVYTGGDRTITGIKVTAAVATAYVSAPVLATYGGAGITLKLVAGGALAGGTLSAARQGAQLLDKTRDDFSFAEVGQGALMGGGLAFVPELAPLMVGAGVASSADEFSQGHIWTGAFDATASFAPFAMKGAPEFKTWARPRAAAIGMRVGMALNEFPALSGSGSGTNFGDIPSIGMVQEPPLPPAAPVTAVTPRIESAGAWSTARPSSSAQAAIQNQVDMGFLDPALAQPGARVATGTAQTGRAITTGVRAQTAESTAYDGRLNRGEVGVLAPVGSNVPGPDYVTAVRLPNGDYEIVVGDAKSRVSGASAFGRVRNTLPASWQTEVNNAIAPGRLGLGDPVAEQAIRDAWAQGRVRIARDTIDYSPQGQGRLRLDN